MVVSRTDYNEFTNQAYTEKPSSTPPPTIDNETAGAKDKKKEPAFSCDHRIKLFILNQTYFLETTGASPIFYKDEPGECHPAYWAAYVRNTNLLLVVVKNENRMYKSSCVKPPDTKPEATDDSKRSREPCHKLNLGRLPRRRLEGCYTYHVKVIIN